MAGRLLLICEFLGVKITNLPLHYFSVWSFTILKVSISNFSYAFLNFFFFLKKTSLAMKLWVSFFIFIFYF